MESNRTLLIVEDDASFAKVLRRSFERRGYEVRICERVDDIDPMLQAFEPHYAVVDLKLASGSGLECVQRLHAFDPGMKIVVLTGFASIATAVEAVNAIISPSPPIPMISKPPFSGRKATPRWNSRSGRPRSRISNGSISTKFWRKLTSISPRPPAGSACTEEPWPANWRRAGSSDE
jgi:CheY-like chemotaxis protein